MVDITGEVADTEETQQLTRGTSSEAEPTASTPTGNLPGDGQQVHSPFTMYLNRVQTPPTASAELEVNRTSSRETSGTDPTSHYVTSSDLEALERRFQVLVSEATATISTRLQDRASTSTETQPETATRVQFDEETRELTSPSKTAAPKVKRNPATRRIQQRQRQRQLAATGSETTGEYASPEQAGTSVRPKPRLQLNLQMFRKHPVFKFFVTAPMDPEANPHKWRCRVCSIELSLKTKGALEILSHYRTEAHLIREHRLRMETPGLPLYGKNEQELVGPSLDEAREKAELNYPIAPTLGECYLLPGQRELPADVDVLDPSAVICSQIRILITGLQHGGNSDTLRSLWSTLCMEVRGPAKAPQYNWCPERVFVSIVCLVVFSS